MIANVLVGLVALIHLYIVHLEMVLWNTPRGHKLFKLTPEFASASKVLAANQGLYNGFLAAGLIWGFTSARPVSRSRCFSCSASPAAFRPWAVRFRRVAMDGSMAGGSRPRGTT
jgi:uncharacterized membrane protein